MSQLLRSFIIDGLVQTIQTLYENSGSAVLLNSQLGEFFKTTVGVCLGYLLSSNPVQLVPIMQETTTTTHPSPIVEGPHATYTDNINLMGGSNGELHNS